MHELCYQCIHMIIVQACTWLIVHACTIIRIHACTMIIVPACTMTIVHSSTMRIACKCHDHSTCMSRDHSTCMYSDHRFSVGSLMSRQRKILSPRVSSAGFLSGFPQRILPADVALDATCAIHVPRWRCGNPLTKNNPFHESPLHPPALILGSFSV